MFFDAIVARVKALWAEFFGGPSATPVAPVARLDARQAAMARSIASSFRSPGEIAGEYSSTPHQGIVGSDPLDDVRRNVDPLASTRPRKNHKGLLRR